MPKFRLKNIIGKTATYSLTAIPYGGNVIAQFLADQSAEDLKELLLEIKRISQDEIKSLNTTESELHIIKEILCQLIGDKSKKDKLTVVIPAGGEGGSLFPVTKVMPKCLVTIGYKSMLQHIIDLFYPYIELFEKIIVVTGNYSKAIEENVKQGGYGDFVECMNISGKTLPDALLKLKDHLPQKPFVLHYNDVLIENCNWDYIYSRYFEYQEQCKHIGMLLCSRYYPHPLGIGVIEEGRTDTVYEFKEKPDKLIGGNLANLAVAIFETEIFDYMEPDHIGLFEETIHSIIDAKRTISLYRIERWHHVQDLNTLFHLQNHADLGFLTKRFT